MDRPRPDPQAFVERSPTPCSQALERRHEVTDAIVEGQEQGRRGEAIATLLGTSHLAAQRDEHVARPTTQDCRKQESLPNSRT